MDIKDDVTIQSWDGTWTYRPKVLVTPQTPEDIVEIVKSVVRFPSPVRPAGSMHSTARMNGDDGGTMVDMKAMNRILKFGEDTVTVEGGVSYQTVSNALKERGLQFHVMTEIGNVTLAAMATAATKDSSFPGEYGQISSYVTAMRFVTPQGDIREINERDHPEEMQVMRSSYGLLGIVFEVTIRVRPTTALSVRHHSMGLEEFRKRFPVFKAQGYAVMYYIFPYARCVVVELRKDNPEAKPVSRRRWAYRNRFWRKYGPALSHWIRRRTSSPRLRAAADDLNFYFLRQGLVRIVRHDATWPHAQHINYPRNPGPQQIHLQHVGLPRRRLLQDPRGLLRFLHRLCRAHRVSLRPAERRLFDRAGPQRATVLLLGRRHALHRPCLDRRQGMGGLPARLQRFL